MTGRIDYDALEKPAKIDVKDKKILSLLSEDARMPFTQLAKAINLSRDATAHRVERMVKEGIILRFFPNINYDKLGHYTFHVFLLIDEMDKQEQDNLIADLKKHPNIISVIEYSDRWDLELVLLAKDLLEFDHVILEIAAKYPHIILEKDKLEIIRRYNSSFVPPLIREKGHEMDAKVVRRAPPAKVDSVDLHILRLLAKDCRTSTYEIATELGVSADAVGYRIKNLLREEIIRNFTILVNLSKMKYHWYTFSVEMKMFDTRNEKKFESFLQKHKNIIRSVKTLGGWDLLLYVIVQNPREFHHIVKDLKSTFANVVRNYQTWVAFKEHTYNPMPKALEN
jgi:DNA-binding Lrp family transcriptional regulator|tara:strand:+ start:179 stop:1195 length:1017 start_codon:yes stop_codon:yes gene_type:complete